MSEQENLEIVQRAYKAFAEGDLPTLLKLLADDVEWSFPSTYGAFPGHNTRGEGGMESSKP
jgi:ketosteroid isomerase-like protein